MSISWIVRRAAGQPTPCWLRASLLALLSLFSITVARAQATASIVPDPNYSVQYTPKGVTLTYGVSGTSYGGTWSHVAVTTGSQPPAYTDINTDDYTHQITWDQPGDVIIKYRYLNVNNKTVTTSLTVHVVDCVPVLGATPSNPIEWGELSLCPQNQVHSISTSANCLLDDYYPGSTTSTPNNSLAQPSPDIYYHFTLAQSCRVVASTCGSNFDTYIHIRSKTTGSIWDNDNTSICGGGSSRLDLTLPAGNYELIAEGAGTATGQLQVSLQSYPAVPAIGVLAGTAQLRSDLVDIAPNTSVNLTAQLTGAAASVLSGATYQWQPATGLNTTTGTSVTASPSTTTTYRVTATYCNGQTVQTEIMVRVVLSNRNYITTRTPQIADLRTLYDLNGQSVRDVPETTQYFDGLGRADQTVSRQASPGAHDIVAPITYDALGRPLRTYLSYASSGTDGNYKTDALTAQPAAYTVTGDRIANDAAPWTEQGYEQSPGKTLVAQGAPGTAWQPASGHAQKSTQRSNRANEVLRWHYDYYNRVYSFADYYPAGTLTVSEKRDEHDVLTLVFEDKERHVVLRQQQLAATPGTVCGTQAANGNLFLAAPTSTTQLTSVQSARWGRLATGSGTGCDNIVFDGSGSVDVTAAVQQLYAVGSSPSGFSVTASNALASADPAPGSPKWLKVVMNCTPSTGFASTYYVYDDFGLLRLVLQPKGVDQLSSWGSSGALSQSDQIIQQYGFTYDYDARHRVIEKTVPGGGLTAMLYDRADRLVGTQNGLHAQQGAWNITKYDALNRPVLTAYVHTYYTTYANRDRDQLQAKLNDPQQTPTLNEVRDGSSLGYSQQTFPALQSADEARTATYYDDYNYNRLSGKSFVTENAVTAATPISNLLGQVTGRAEYVLDAYGYDPLVTVTYYDDKYRPVQVQTDHYGGGSTRTTSELDFARLRSMLVTHSNGTTTHTLRNRFVYDAGGRPEYTYQQMEYGRPNQVAEVLVAGNEYNEIGQLVDKKLHSIDAASLANPKRDASFLQSVDYRYNIRGWLSNINDRNLSNNGSAFNDADPNQDDPALVEPDLFGMELMYNKNQNLSQPGQPGVPLGRSQFNGNIAEVMWQTRGKAELRKLRAYAYNYDNANRLTSAAYRTYENPNGFYEWGTSSSDYSVPQVQYDLNGNITRLERKGQTNLPSVGVPAQFGDLDKLTYYYSGNQLVGVDEDNGLTTAATHDFEDNGSTYSSQSQEYYYDDAGNMLYDLNKSQAYIVYNELNLPEYVYLNGFQNYIHYTYSAGGTKLQKETSSFSTGSGHVTTYAGGFVYEDGVLSFGPMPEGRVLYVNGSATGGFDWKYEYQLKDNLGNLRFAFRDQGGTSTQRTASMEPANASQEEQQFHHVADTRQRDAERARTGEYVARLSAREGRRLGPSIRWNVQAGDSVVAEVYGRYDHGSGAGQLSRVAALAAGATLTPNLSTRPAEQAPLPAARQQRLPFLGLSLGVVPQLFAAHPARVPQAYLRYELFDRDSQLVSVQTRPLQRTATDEWQHLTAGIKADSAGFVRVALLNDSDEPAYFDDLALRPVEPVFYQENHYDPWGLNLVGIENAGTPDSKFQFNGKEKQEDFGLDWTDFGARMYDMQLGRWQNVDPLADAMRRHSPYNYCFDNPLRFIDPDGMGPETVRPLGSKAQTAYTDYVNNATRAAASTDPTMRASGQRALQTIAKLEKSTVTYYINADESTRGKNATATKEGAEIIRTGPPAASNGGSTDFNWDSENQGVVISLKPMDNAAATQGILGDELTTAGQFEDGRFGFSVESGGDNANKQTMYDYTIGMEVETKEGAVDAMRNAGALENGTLPSTVSGSTSPKSSWPIMDKIATQGKATPDQVKDFNKNAYPELSGTPVPLPKNNRTARMQNGQLVVSP